MGVVSSYKVTYLLKFPEETAGKDLYHNEMSDSQTHLNYVPCDRETIVFSLDEISATQGGAEEGDFVV